MKKITKIYPALILFFILLSGCIEFNDSNNGENIYGGYDEYTFIQTHEHFYGTVYKVVDGDTVYVVAPNGTEYKIRLLGVDTPETYVKNKPYEYFIDENTAISDTNYLKEWGYKATDFAKENLENKTVTVVFDKRSSKKGKYGRYLAYIFINNITYGIQKPKVFVTYWIRKPKVFVNFNEELIKNGYARVYISDFELKDVFLEYEKHAKSQRIGMWNWNNT